MIENSENPNPTSQVMCKIADALELSLDDLRKEWNKLDLVVIELRGMRVLTIVTRDKKSYLNILFLVVLCKRNKIIFKKEFIKKECFL